MGRESLRLREDALRVGPRKPRDHDRRLTGARVKEGNISIMLRCTAETGQLYIIANITYRKHLADRGKTADNGWDGKTVDYGKTL